MNVWKVHFAQRSVLHLTVTAPRPSGAGPESLVVEQLRSRHDLAAEAESAEFAFDLQGMTGGVRSLTFACDPPLWAYRAELAGGDDLERWSFTRAKPGERGSLTLHFRKPLRGLLQPRLYFHVVDRSAWGFDRPDKGRAALPAGTWLCPGVYPATHVAGSPSGGQASARRDDRGAASGRRCAGRLAGRRVPADGGGRGQGHYRLTLAGTGLAGPGDLARGPDAWPRPRGVLRALGVDYHAEVQSWWRLGESSALQVRVRPEVRHGRMFELPVLVSPGWEVERSRADTGRPAVASLGAADRVLSALAVGAGRHKADAGPGRVAAAVGAAEAGRGGRAAHADADARRPSAGPHGRRRARRVVGAASGGRAPGRHQPVRRSGHRLGRRAASGVR